MTYTGEDRVLEKLMPAIRASRPRTQLLLNKATGRAVTDDGYINPAAILPGSSVQVDFGAASNTASSSDTVNPAEYLGTTFTLFEGVWRLKARVAVTGSLSGSSNLNAYCVLNGEASTNFQIPIAAANQLATVFAYLSLDEVQGEVTLQGMFRPSAGTATIEAGEWLYRAERIR
jgi:hypothetical protein